MLPFSSSQRFPRLQIERHADLFVFFLSTLLVPYHLPALVAFHKRTTDLALVRAFATFSFLCQARRGGTLPLCGTPGMKSRGCPLLILRRVGVVTVDSAPTQD